jgi:branched-chain amino acid transport system ATP-binding protein
MLLATGLNKSFGGIRAVQDLSLEAGDTGIVGIIGPNGAGKTTIINLISGIYVADSGTIEFNGQDVTAMKQHEIARLGISRTFQNIRLFKGLNCLDTVKTACDYKNPYNVLEALFYTPKVRKAEKLLEEEAFNYLEMVGLSDLADERPENLPYGLQRRLEIARALINKPSLLLLDEPAAGLNQDEVCDLIELIRGIHRNNFIGMIIIEHKMEVIMNLCQKIYVQSFGKTIAVGTPREVQTHPEVLKAYLGEEG